MEYLTRNLLHPEYDAIFNDTENEGEEKVDNEFVNKYYLVAKLIEKKTAYKKAKGIKRAELAFDLENAYYNLSYNGAHWHCLAYMKSSGNYGYLGDSNVE